MLAVAATTTAAVGLISPVPSATPVRLLPPLSAAPVPYAPPVRLLSAAPPRASCVCMNEERKLLSWWRRQLSEPGQPVATGTLILVRHGETEVPRGSSFIGWSDPDLNKMGEDATVEAARAIKEAGYSFDVAYTSVLKRAVRTTWLLLQELDKIYLPVWKHWRLNERCYGALTAESIDSVQKTVSYTHLTLPTILLV